ncbi:KTSC domain-containing protein [Leclercia sp. H6W5]|uniref:KTSC domain-containing protein n=1 Tax=Leclercia tamurae TaxID=2926467 RepID=UPI0021D0D219|nr:KTSC domain-containing protein [Leclercia tamurae]
MNHHSVNSSRIASIAYDTSNETLEVRFRDHSAWQYQSVPVRIFNDFLSVVSKGRLYDGVVKGKFKERKIA